MVRGRSSSTHSSQKVNVNRVLTSGTKFGKTLMIITSVVLSIIAFVLLVLSVKQFITPDQPKATTKGIIKEASCLSTYGGRYSSSNINCTLKVAYRAGNTSFEKVINVVSKKTFIVGQEVDVEYLVNDLNNVRLCCDSSHITKGLWLLFFSVLLFGSAAFNWFYRDNYFASITAGTRFWY